MYDLAGENELDLEALRARSPSEKYYATHVKTELLRSTNFSRGALPSVRRVKSPPELLELRF